MKKHLLLFSLLLAPFFLHAQTPQKLHDFDELDKDMTGHVYFEDVYNVFNRSADEVFKYVMSFMNSTEKPVIDFTVDKENREVTFKYSWFIGGYKHNCVHHSTITADVTISAKQALTRIHIGKIFHKSEGGCNKQGMIEELLYCAECKKSAINNMQGWLKKEMTIFMKEYKTHLEEESAKERTW